MNLQFLNTLTVTTLESQKAVATKKETNPDPNSLRLRIWKDGSIFPSARLVSEYSLEYPKATSVQQIKLVNEDGSPKMIPGKDGAPETQATKRKLEFDPATVSNGLDVFTLHAWTQIAEAERMASPNIILVGVTPKSAPKVELFANVKYNDDGSAASSVLDQGAPTYGKAVLLPLLKELYNVEPNEEGFIDLEILPQFDQTSKVPNRVFIFPKSVARGEEKGKPSYEMRTCTGIFPLVPAAVIEEPAQSGEAQPADAQPMEDTQPVMDPTADTLAVN